jgi:hypothetical protein
MAPIKAKETFFQPDPTNDFFPLLSLEKHYEIVSKYCELLGEIPEGVRSYFNAVITLYLYGWLYYPFYTLANFLSSVVVEMALRERLPWRPERTGQDRRGLKKLLTEAKAAGLLREEGFPTLENTCAGAEQLRQELSEFFAQETEVEPKVPYVDVLIEALPQIRNSFAHPGIHAILAPGQALNGLILAAEIINQLWPKQTLE